MKMKISLLYIVCVFFSLIFISASKNINANSDELGQVKPKVESGFIDVKDGRIYYETAGKGDVIVLVHDGSLHNATWDGQFLAFAENYKVIRYDRRGYGKSTWPETPFSNVEDLNSVFKFFNVEKAAVMGMSAGGGLSIDFTLEYPNKVTALVLVGAVVSGYGYTPHFLSRGGRIDATYFPNPEKLINYMFKEDPYTIYFKNKEAKEKALKLMLKNPHNYDFRKNRFSRGPKRLALGALGEIKVPTLIVVGEYDIPDVHAHAGAIEAGIKNSERVVVKNSAHLVPLEKPEVFNRLALSFLKSSDFLNILYNKGTIEALQYFEKLVKDGINEIPFNEAKINVMGYNYLQKGKTDDAVNLFKLNVLAYPGSWNAYDSLAEAYMTKGDNENAIKYYKKAIELNPDNDNAKSRLKTLEREN
ncbi:alpha/beta fold hydrolase [candidate division KSB1 bacterium]